ncbi:hypothetical protein SDC9_171368 [bioreactor metagenome]|uniref:Uncharacterized protein n=1 Tax=bioreactor metagenome TaxID=1076179 RepID=A0A645GBF8_9ZZZZ
MIPAAKILRADNRAAGAERGKNADDQIVEGIDEGNAGDGGLADPRNHNGCGKTDHHRQQLLENQGNDQLPQGRRRKDGPLSDRSLFHRGE